MDQPLKPIRRVSRQTEKSTNSGSQCLEVRDLSDPNSRDRCGI
jgi:hypothetical protein